jgi:hypothetical protein
MEKRPYSSLWAAGPLCVCEIGKNQRWLPCWLGVLRRCLASARSSGDAQFALRRWGHARRCPAASAG